MTEGFDVKFFRQIPFVGEQETVFGVTRSREHLEKQGNLRQARLILDTEVDIISNQISKQAACISLLKACRQSNKPEPMWFVEGRIKVQLTQALNQDQQPEAACREFDLAKDLLQQAPVPAIENNAELNVRLSQLSSTKISNASVAL